MHNDRDRPDAKAIGLPSFIRGDEENVPMFMAKSTFQRWKEQLVLAIGLVICTLAESARAETADGFSQWMWW